MAAAHPSRDTAQQYVPGQRVWLQDHRAISALGTMGLPKLTAGWKGPYIVTERIGEVTYRVRPLGSQALTDAHLSRLKPLHDVAHHLQPCPIAMPPNGPTHDPFHSISVPPEPQEPKDVPLDSATAATPTTTAPKQDPSLPAENEIFECTMSALSDSTVLVGRRLSIVQAQPLTSRQQRRHRTAAIQIRIEWLAPDKIGNRVIRGTTQTFQQITFKQLYSWWTIGSRPTKRVKRSAAAAPLAEVSSIVGRKGGHDPTQPLQYRVRWKGYSAEHDEWVAESDLQCPDLVAAFELKTPTP